MKDEKNFLLSIAYLKLSDYKFGIKIRDIYYSRRKQILFINFQLTTESNKKKRNELKNKRNNLIKSVNKEINNHFSNPIFNY